MSKPISFGFNKNKPKPGISSTANTNTNSAHTGSSGSGSNKSNGPSLSLPKFKVAAPLPPSKRISRGLPNPRTALSAINDGEEDDEEEPQHESVTGFSKDGAILSVPVQEKQDLVIENSGNQDWRRRNNRSKGRDLLPQEVRAAREGQDVVMVEKDEVSTASGLQFAETERVDRNAMDVAGATGIITASGATGDVSAAVIAAATHYIGDANGVNGFSLSNGTSTKTEVKRTSEVDDEAALAALLSDNPNAPRSNTVIEIAANAHIHGGEETDDFRADVASRPDSSTLDEYAAMPVEEFGLAMLRGMGRKRRANGEVIALPDFNSSNNDGKDGKSQRRKQDGFLGIGAKPVSGPGMEGVELGAWGKADMRKNAKGEGFFTPLMVRDTKTGEVVTEEEMERRKKAKKEGEREGEMEWKERRDRNLERHGRDRSGDEKLNGSSTRRREREIDGGSGSDSARSSRRNGDRDRDRDRDSDYDSGRSSRRRRSRSRSKDQRRADEEGQSDEDGYDSRSSRKYKSDGRDRDRDREQHSHRDKYGDRSYGHDRDHDRRHRDRDRDRDRGRR